MPIHTSQPPTQTRISIRYIYHIYLTQNMAKILITLPDAMLEEIDKVLESGRYASRSELVREAMRRLLGTGEGHWSYG